jgi:hypothetical protein
VIVDNTPIAHLTQMRVGPWRAALNHGGNKSYRALHPKESAAILVAIELGVPVEFIGDRSLVRDADNHGSLDDHLEAVAAVIEKDVAAGKKAGPLARAGLLHGHPLCISPIGAVTKKGSTKVRVIHDLSYPRDGECTSVNDGIVDVYSPISSFGHAARAVRALGPGCLLIKLDVEAAYKQVPVRREDWHLLGFKFKGRYYYERVLPFGLRSSCRLWDMFACALHFFCERMLGVKAPHFVVHYVDDFLFVVSAVDGGAAARAMLEGALRLCVQLGVPMAPAKVEGPCTELVFLGIILDTFRMEARLPPQRIDDLTTECLVWQSPSARRSLTELQSLAGHLNHACAVIRPGRIFMRHIFEQMRRMEHVLKDRQGRPLSRGAKLLMPRGVIEDVSWWAEFLPQWNNASLLYELEWQEAPNIHLYTDASHLGYGGFYQGQWFAGAWSPAALVAARRAKRLSMPYLELLALVLAASSWGEQWRGKKITFLCDCKGVVDAITGQRSASPSQMHLLRQLTLIACRDGFDFRARHIPGVTNTIADALSRSGAGQAFLAAVAAKGLPPPQPRPISLVWPSLLPPVEAAPSARQRSA